MTKSSKMQKPDLSRSHCKMLQIRGHATVDKNQLKEIESFVPKEVVKNRQMLVTGSRYKKRKATFHCILKVGEFFKAVTSLSCHSLMSIIPPLPVPELPPQMPLAAAHTRNSETLPTGCCQFPLSVSTSSFLLCGRGGDVGSSPSRLAVFK